MNSTTEVPQTLSSRSTQPKRPDPSTVWEPLARLADAAAATVSGAETIAIARGFDRHSRQRAKALTELLTGRDLPAVEVTPAPESVTVLEGKSVAAVVNLVGAGSWQPYRLAAGRQALLINPELDAGAAPSERSQDVIALAGTDNSRDVALTRLAIQPENAEEASIVLTRDGEPLSVPGGQVEITLQEGGLDIHLEGPSYAAQRFTAKQISLETFLGPHRLVRDEQPIAEFEGALTFTCEADGLTIRSV